MSKKPHIALRPLVAFALCALTACSSQPKRASIPATPPPSLDRIDFSGHWEMDYTRSDDLNQKLTDVFREMNRAAQATQGGNRRYSGISSGGANVVAVARLADFITRPEILEIVQSTSSIEVEREDDYTLTCDLQSAASQRVESAFGGELCGWDGRQMVFHLTLPDRVVVMHRMTMSPDRQDLHIATTVESGGGSQFTMSRFYSRFEPLPTAYKCEDTFSRKKVCSARPPD